MFKWDKNKGDKTLIAILSSDETRNELERAVVQLPNLKMSIKQTKDTLGNADTLVNGSADIVIIEADFNNPLSNSVLERLCNYVSFNGTLIVLADNPTIDDIRSLFKAGVNDVLSLPVTRDDLLVSLQTALNAELKSQTSIKSGKVITLVKCGGGVGATTLATNLAYSLMNNNGTGKKGKAGKTQSAVILDFDIQFGNVALSLDIEPKHNLLDIMKVKNRLDAVLMDSTVQKHKSGINVLPCPNEIVPFTALESDFLQNLLSISRSMYDYTIIDMPQAWGEWTPSIFANSDIIIPILTPSVEHAKGIQKIISCLTQLNIGPEKTMLIINKVVKGLSTKDRISQIKKMTDRPTILIHENEKLHQAARDRGVLLTDISANHKSIKEINDCAKQIQKHLLLNTGKNASNGKKSDASTQHYSLGK